MNFINSVIFPIEFTSTFANALQVRTHVCEKYRVRKCECHLNTQRQLPKPSTFANALQVRTHVCEKYRVRKCECHLNTQRQLPKRVCYISEDPHRTPSLENH